MGPSRSRDRQRSPEVRYRLPELPSRTNAAMVVRACGCGVVVARDLSTVEVRVRFPPPAQRFFVVFFRAVAFFVVFFRAVVLLAPVFGWIRSGSSFFPVERFHSSYC